MGYYETICGTCGGPAIFFSIGPMWVDCQKCLNRFNLLNLFAAKIREENNATDET